MTDASWPAAPPQRILLATDLGARSDRALDRAAQLARQWNAALIVVHALERAPDIANWSRYDDAPSWRRPPDPAVAIERQIRRDLRDPVSDLKIYIEEGEPHQVVLDIVARERCDLIVLGTARDETLGRVALGANVQQLVRRAPVSVLVVKTRPAGPYNHILVGTDFTDEARHGLSVAGKLFPDSLFTVMHAFDLPYRWLATDTPLSREFAAMERDTINSFVAEAALPSGLRVVTLTEHGPPEIMLRKYVVEKNANLTVIGALGRGLLFHVLVGGNAPRIVDGVPSDVLVVRAPSES